jgi:DDE family transposase
LAYTEDHATELSASSLPGLAAQAAAQGLADVSDVALMARIRNSADWLQSLCAEGLARAAAAIGVNAAPRPIRIVDGSRLEGPGARTWRLHLCYDVGSARIVDAAITTTREGERLNRLAVTPGEIRLADRGFPQPDGIKATLDAGADLLVRLTWNSLQMRLADGRPIDWRALFAQASAQGSLDLAVRMQKAHSRFEPIPMRLVIIKKRPEAAARARAKTRRASAKNQRRIDPRTIAGADHIVLLTSLGREEFPVAAVGALYRLRWQIEIAFKRLKSILHIDRLPAKDPDLARAWLHAHLLLALLLDTTMADLDAVSPSAADGATAFAMAQYDAPRRRIARRHLAAA